MQTDEREMEECMERDILAAIDNPTHLHALLPSICARLFGSPLGRRTVALLDPKSPFLLALLKLSFDQNNFLYEIPLERLPVIHTTPA